MYPFRYCNHKFPDGPPLHSREEWRDAWCDRVDGLDADSVAKALSDLARQGTLQVRLRLFAFTARSVGYSLHAYCLQHIGTGFFILSETSVDFLVSLHFSYSVCQFCHTRRIGQTVQQGHQSQPSPVSDRMNNNLSSNTKRASFAQAPRHSI